jgi:hypothetical protein
MRAARTLAVIAALPLVAACATTVQEPAPAAPPAAEAVLPSSIPAAQLVGNWGLGSYHQEAQRGRTEAMARTQCRNPYRITAGPTGGIMMHLADAAQPSELRLKGSPDGKNYIGPDGPIDTADREIVTFTGQIMTLRWLDPDVAGRYGTMIYVRCR